VPRHQSDSINVVWLSCRTILKSPSPAERAEFLIPTPQICRRILCGELLASTFFLPLEAAPSLRSGWTRRPSPRSEHRLVRTELLLTFRQAHDHARAASIATHTSDATAAVNEHALAAGEFSNATKATANVEALRTLRLLEEHHHRLAGLLRHSIQQPLQSSGSDGDAAEVAEKTAGTIKDDGDVETGKPHAASTTKAASKSGAQAATTLQQRLYPPSRELSSSIASNLASARGIRSKQRGQPVAPSVSNDVAPGSVEGGSSRKDGSKAQMQNMLHQTGKPSWVPPLVATPALSETRFSDNEVPKNNNGANPGDEGYSRFYSTFGSLFNRLSAPLAFAGLPLIAEESMSESTPTAEQAIPRRHRGRVSQVSSPDPELSKVYSKAALRALSRDGHGPNDSFYVVPKTGHTVSYANILSFDQKEKRRIAASIHGDDDLLEDPDEDDFVDARESQFGLSPAIRKRLGKSKTEKELQNVVEELFIENQGLKDMLDKLSKRLHAFEANAQNSHMALQESIRFLRPGSPLSSSGTAKAPAGEDALSSRNKELEERLALATEQMEKMERDRSRMERNLDVYRDKWEKLKAGAKARREAQGSPAGAGPSKPPT